MKPGRPSYITKALFQDGHQNLPLVTVEYMIENPNLYSFIFSYLKLREHYSFSAGRILRSEIDVIGNVIGKKRSATFIHLAELVKLGYLRKTNLGWQLVSIYRTSDRLRYKSSALMARVNNNDVRTWTLNQFKAHITYLYNLNWSNKKYHKELLEKNEVAYVHDGKYYKEDHTLVSKRKMKRDTSTYLNGRDLSLSLIAAMTGCHKSTARRRVLSCPEREKRYIVSKRDFVVENKTCLLFDQVDHLNATHQEDGVSFNPNKGVEKRMGKYIIGAGCKIYFQPATRVIYHEGVISKRTIRKASSKFKVHNYFGSNDLFNNTVAV